PARGPKDRARQRGGRPGPGHRMGRHARSERGAGRGVGRQVDRTGAPARGADLREGGWSRMAKGECGRQPRARAELVEDLYRQIQLPRSWVRRLTEELEAEIVERQAEASERRVLLTKTLAKLAEERGKLLQAFYANAIPLESPQDGAGPHRRSRAGSQGRARDGGGRPR